jgi:undecaprenyl-diphosphatase
VLVATGHVAGPDSATFDRIRLESSSHVVGVFRVVALAGGVEATAVVVLAFWAAAIALPSLRPITAVLTGALLATGIVEVVLKNRLDHPPPVGVSADLSELIISTPFSYPSGHTVRVVCVGLCIALVLGSRRWRWAPAVWAGVVAIVVAVLYTRLALAQHWFSDVVGGLLLSAAVLPWLTVAAPRRSGNGSRTQPAGTRASARRLGRTA